MNKKIYKSSPIDTTLQQAVLPILSVLTVPFPAILTSLLLIQTFYATVIQLKQDKVNDFVRIIIDNPEIFTEEILSTEAFEEGFMISFEQYLKMRGEKKRRIAKRIFLDFVGSNDKENFKLERLYGALFNISFEGIEYLRFLQQTIAPRMEAEIRAEAKRLGNEDPTKEQWHIENAKHTQPFSYFLTKWIEENYNPNSPKVKTQYHQDPVSGEYSEPLQDIFDKEMVHKVKAREMMAEYVSLGIFRVEAEGSGALGAGGASTVYHMTDFGREFLSFIQKADQYEANHH